MKALVVGNGEPPSRELFDTLMVAKLDMVICADGGADTVRAFGVEPDAVVGDLDSASEEVLQHTGAARRVRIDADNTGTDLNKALSHAVSLGVTEAVLTGVTGRRIDHCLWNLSLLKTFADRLDLHIVDDWQSIWLLRMGRTATVHAAVGQLISLVPLDGPVRGVRTEGLRWPLDGEDLVPGQRDGVSNQMQATPASVCVDGAGDLLVVVQARAGDGAWVETG